MKKILLIAPFNNKKIRVGQFVAPSIGIYRIASHVKQKLNVNVIIYDCNLESVKGLYELVKKQDFDIIGFSLLHHTLKNDLHLMFNIHKRSPNSLLIAGGQGAVFNIDFLLNKTPLKIIVKGFGEFSVEELITNFEKKGNLIERFEDIKGIAIKSGTDIIHTKERFPYTQDQFREISLSFDFKDVPYEKYWDFMDNIYSKKHLKLMKNEDMLRTIRIITSSHCQNKCKFCSSTNFLNSKNCAHRPLLLSPEDIIKIMKNAVESHPTITAIYFNDDNFLQDTNRISELCNYINEKQEFQNLSFFCLSRVDNVESNILLKMKKTGFKFIIYGVESFSNKLLTDMNKNINATNPAELTKQVIKKTIDTGIDPLMNIILFYPTTDIDDIIKTIDNSVELVDYGARINVYSYVEVYPGSKILEEKYLSFRYNKFKVENKEFILPDLIIPFSDKIRKLAEQSLKLRTILLDSIIKKYKWKGIIPHPVHSLLLFLAVYKILKLDTTKIDTLIDKIMIKELENNIMYSTIKLEERHKIETS